MYITLVGKFHSADIISDGHAPLTLSLSFCLFFGSVASVTLKSSETSFFAPLVVYFHPLLISFSFK